MFRLFKRKPKSGTLTESDRVVLFFFEMERFSERMAEERRKRGHIVYPEGVFVSPGAWPACPPDCEHVTPKP